MTVIVWLISTLVGVLLATIIIRAITWAADRPPKHPTTLDPLPPPRWRIRKRNGVWEVRERRWWHTIYGHSTGVEPHYCDRLRFAAPNFTSAIEYCERNHQ